MGKLLKFILRTKIEEFHEEILTVEINQNLTQIFGKNILNTYVPAYFFKFVIRNKPTVLVGWGSLRHPQCSHTKNTTIHDSVCDGSNANIHINQSTAHRAR